MREYLLALMPPHKTYVEPFAGGLSVLLGKPRTKCEVVNDINENLVMFFRYVRNAKGERFMLSECRVAYTPKGINYGYTEYPSRSAALAAFGVEEIPESELFPNMED